MIIMKNIIDDAKLEEDFMKIKSYFSNLDAQMKSSGAPLHYDTELGIWGPSGMDETFELFKRIHLENYRNFVDLGSGDGRISIIASLFTRSCGIEADHDLTLKSESAKKQLNLELHQCEFLENDYTTTDLSRFDILFTFNDHTWNLDFENKLLYEFKGVLFSYSKVFLPKRLKKGKTYWIAGQPIVSYHINTQERDLFVDKS